jgi:hypothetical protein
MHKALAFAALTISVAAAAPAHAGYKQTSAIYIDSVNRVAQGSLADTRNDQTPSSWVRIAVEATTTYVSANVHFKIPDKDVVGCFTSNPGMIQALATATNDALVTVYWDANGQCTSVLIHNSSYNSPKTP